MAANPIKSVLGTPSFANYEREIYQKHQENAECEIVESIDNLFQNLAFMVILKQWAGCSAFHFHGWRYINIRLKSGRQWRILSPVFLKAKSKVRKRGRIPNRRKKVLLHLGLELIGIFERASPALTELCVHMAAICPSFEVAAQSLKNFGVKMNPRFLRQMTLRFGSAAIKHRVNCHANENWKKSGLRIQVCVDAGRARERRTKRGKRAKGLKRQGFHSDWIAPWLLTINTFDENGKIVKDVPAIIDGSCEKINEFYDLLEQHLRAINIEEAIEIVFCADGGCGIWPRFEELAQKLNLKNSTFVLDYTHAKQNMAEITTTITEALKLSNKKAQKLQKKISDMLWQGDIKGIEATIMEMLSKKKRALNKTRKKLNDYFGNHAKFQYASYKAKKIPVGSGAVESAIRRIINLRVKSSGMFWKKENVEIMIFLRSLVLTGKLRNAFEKTLDAASNMLNDNMLDALKMAA